MDLFPQLQLSVLLLTVCLLPIVAVESNQVSPKNTHTSSGLDRNQNLSSAFGQLVLQLSLPEAIMN